MHKVNISVRYAKALYAYSAKGGNEHRVYECANMLIKSFGTFPALASALENPTIKRDEKHQLLVSASGKSIPAELENFFELILGNDREPETLRIFLSFSELYRKRNDIHRCRVTTAVETNSETESRIITAVMKATGGKVEIEKIVDPSIIGGFILEVENRMLDASVSGKLKQIRKNLTVSV